MPSSPDRNPYAPPTAAAVKLDAVSDAEPVREMYRSHEAAIKRMGTLFLACGIFACLVTAIHLYSGWAALSQPRSYVPAGQLFGLALLSGAIAVVLMFLARGLCRLEQWANIATSVLSCIGLLAFPVGTVICAYFLYLLQSQKGLLVFSDEYKQMTGSTPDIEHKTSIAGWTFLALLVLLIAALGLAVAFRLRH